ncbi:toxin-antitoxin system YwqK family antitoxin [uncultured Hymenobacter sp.]|uniref:toxin-antitoxin system YwqK family antitoxin n=1 Tax=uncultured Hymenobacter sp. TaxID=170016 RepID=UPI0035CAEF6A
MKKYLLLLEFTIGSVCVTVSSANAQPIKAYFKDQSGNHSAFGFGSSHQVRTGTMRGADGAGVITRYFASGQKPEEIPYQLLRKNELHGTQTRWFENGPVQATEQYTNSQRHGQLLTYYPDGTLRRREEFQNGKQMKAECFAANGRPAAYFDYLQFTEYRGGLANLLATIQSSTRYPKDALRKQQEGKVVPDFVVNSLCGWTPAQLDGNPTDVVFTLPVSFLIR